MILIQVKLVSIEMTLAHSQMKNNQIKHGDKKLNDNGFKWLIKYTRVIKKNLLKGLEVLISKSMIEINQTSLNELREKS